MHAMANTMTLMHDATFSMLLAWMEANPTRMASLQATLVEKGIQDAIPGAPSSAVKLATLTPPEASSCYTA